MSRAREIKSESEGAVKKKERETRNGKKERAKNLEIANAIATAPVSASLRWEIKGREEPYTRSRHSSSTRRSSTCVCVRCIFIQIREVRARRSHYTPSQCGIRLAKKFHLPARGSFMRATLRERRGSTYVREKRRESYPSTESLNHDGVREAPRKSSGICVLHPVEV